MFDFGLSYSHMLVIVIVAVIAIGPKDLPLVLRRFGQFMNKVRGMAREFQGHVDNAMRDAGMSDIKKDLQSLKSGINNSVADPATTMTSSRPAVASAGVTVPAPSFAPDLKNGFGNYFGSADAVGETRVAGREVGEPTS